MRSPPHAAVRMHAPVDHVRAILACARQQAIDAAIREGRSPSDRAALHRAEQTLLLTRLAADSGARRGELAALQLTDLDGDVLTIARGTSNEVVGPTKTGRIRRLTLGPTTAALWRHTVEQWRQRADALIRTYRPVATPPAGRDGRRRLWAMTAVDRGLSCAVRAEGTAPPRLS